VGEAEEEEGDEEVNAQPEEDGEGGEGRGGRSRRAAGRKSGREKKRMKIAVVKSTRVAPNAINR